MIKPTITLVRRGNTDTYQVKQTTDTMEVKIGDCLGESDVEKLIDPRRRKVIIKADWTK